MVLASSAAAAAPAKEVPRPLALSSIRANPEARACETPPAKAPATASERTVFPILEDAMRISLGSQQVIGRCPYLLPVNSGTIAQPRNLANGPDSAPCKKKPSGERDPREFALAD